MKFMLNMHEAIKLFLAPCLSILLILLLAAKVHNPTNNIYIDLKNQGVQIYISDKFSQLKAEDCTVVESDDTVIITLQKTEY